MAKKNHHSDADGKVSREAKLRKKVIATALKMSKTGLSPGRTGNVSCRFEDGMLITPTGIAYAKLKPSDIVFVTNEGDVPGDQKNPSSEWRFHLAAYGARPDRHALVHTHSMHATVLACAGKSIPPFHYMVAVAGGSDIPLVPYSTFGTETLAEDVATAVEHRDACLMANHGAVALGETLSSALALAHDVEILAEQYFKVLAIGPPNYLLRSEMADVLEKFANYGKQTKN